MNRTDCCNTQTNNNQVKKVSKNKKFDLDDLACLIGVGFGVVLSYYLLHSGFVFMYSLKSSVFSVRNANKCNKEKKDLFC